MTRKQVSELVTTVRMVHRTSGLVHSEPRYIFRVREFIDDSYLQDVTVAFRIVCIVVSTHVAIFSGNIIFGMFQPLPTVSHSSQRTPLILSSGQHRFGVFTRGTENDRSIKRSRSGSRFAVPFTMNRSCFTYDCVPDSMLRNLRMW